MKKIITIAALAVAASMVQAVAVGWNVTNLGYDTNVNASKGVAYFFVVGSTEMGAKTYADIVAIAAKGGDVSAYATGPSSTVDMNSSNGKAGYAYNASGIDLAANTTYQIFAIVYDNASSPKNYIASAETSLALKTSNKTQSFGSAANMGWTPVPEPCTVALLAFGLAAVGLKRKVA